MFNLGWYWAIVPEFMANIEKQIDKIAAGPTEDAARSGLPIQKVGNKAIVRTSGPMIKEAGFWTHYGFAGTRETEQALRSAQADHSIESILWVIDSPGGSVSGLSELVDAVKEIKQSKPIHVQVDGMLASAALWVASHATTIHANKRDMVGSIGARMMMYDYSEAFKENGLKAIPIDTGEHKSAGAQGTVITEEQQGEFQRIVDGFFNDFMSDLSNGRGVSMDALKSLADGRVFFANEEPISSGLIDGIRSTRDAMIELSQYKDEENSRLARARVRALQV